MKIEIKNNKGIIESIDQWPRPMRQNQWKDGRSALLLADFVLNPKSSPVFHELIATVLKQCNIVEQGFVCEPEAKRGLGKDFGSGNRNHDLLMIGEHDGVIGIEAKVSEPFGNYSIDDIIVNGDTEGKRNRAEQLINTLAPNSYRDSKQKNYQLFTALQSTLSCAEKSSELKNIIFLVIVFTGDVLKEKNYEERCRKNNETFKSFLEYINADESGQILKDKPINCWVKKVEVEVDKNYKMASVTNIR